MEVDPTTVARLALKRPHDANSGDTPAPKRVQLSRNPTPDQDSDDDSEQSPTLITSRRRKVTPASAASRKAQTKNTPHIPLPPLFPRNEAPVVTPPLLNNPLPPAFENAPPERPVTEKEPPPTVQNHETTTQSPAIDENDIKATFESFREEWANEPTLDSADLTKIFNTRPVSQMTATAPTQRTTEKEWTLIQTDANLPHLDHHSDNPFDFLTVAKLDSLIRLWRNEKMEANELTNNERMFLGTPMVKKILAKVVCQGSPPLEDERRNMWIRAAILSAIVQRGGNTKEFIDTRLAFDLAKPGYSWVIIPVKYNIFNTLDGLRAALDPRSGTLVLFRPWRDTSAPVQHLYTFGIHNPDDIIPDKVAFEDYTTQMNEALSANGMKILEMLSTRYGDTNTYCSRIKFGFEEGAIPFLISPQQLSRKFWTGPSQKKTPRRVEYRWPPKCRICESESHNTSICPWPTIERGRRPNLNNCRSHYPGWIEPQGKTWGTATKMNPEITDMRPRQTRAAKGGTDNGKGKGRAIELVTEEP